MPDGSEREVGVLHRNSHLHVQAVWYTKYINRRCSRGIVGIDVRFVTVRGSNASIVCQYLDYSG